MAMTLDTAIKFTAKLEGQGLDQLKRGLQGLAQQSSVSKRSLDQLYTATKALGAASNNTIAGLQKQATALKVLRDQAEFGSRKFRLLSNDIAAVEARLQKFQGTAAKGAGIGRGEALLAGVAGGIAAQATQYAVQGAGAVIKVGLDAETARTRLKALTDEFGEYNQAQQASARIAQTLRLSTTEAQDSFSQLYASLRPTGVTLQEIEKAFIGFTAAARNSGATAQESTAALIQLKQALASGVLQGEEFRSIREQAPLVAQAIAKEMGVSVGALKELAAQGEITSDVVLRALGKLSETQLGKLNAQFDTGAQALKDLSNAANELGTELAKTFGPTAVALIRDFTRFIKQAGEVWGSLFGGDGEADARLQDSIKARQLALQDANRRFTNPFSLNTGEKESYLRQREAQIRDRLAAERVTRELKSDQLTPAQLDAQKQADKERASARAAANLKALEDETQARERMEEKLADAAQRNAEQLADFRAETIKRAAELERSLGDQRLQIERNIEATRRRIAGQQEELAFEIQRQQLSAAGLDTKSVDAAEQIAERFRQFSEDKIQSEQTAADQQLQLQRQLEDFKTSVADGIGKIQEGYARSVSNILQDAGDKLAAKMVDGAQAAAGVLGGGRGGALGPSNLRAGSVGGGQLNVGTLVGLAKAAGFSDRDAQIMAAIAMAESGGRSGAFNGNAATGDKSYGLWQVNMLGAMGPERRRQFGISNNAQLFDPATNANAARQVYQSQGFGAWSVYRSGAYRQFLPGAMAAGGAPGGFNSAGLMGGIQRAGQQLGGAIGTEQAVTNQEKFNALVYGITKDIGGITQDLNNQAKSAKDQLTDQQRIYELMRSGMSPELAKQRVDAENIAKAEALQLSSIEAQLDKQIASGDWTGEQLQTLKDIRAEVIARQMNEKGITDEILKQQQDLDELNRRQQALRDLTQSIGGTLSEGIIGGIEAAINAAATGAKGLEDQLKQIASGVLKDIGNALLRFGLNSLLGGFQIGGQSIFKFAQGGVMTSAGTVPLKKYASGGVANRPQLALYGEGSKPEAYVPLPDGRRIPVALQGQDKMRDAMGAGPMQGATSPVLNMKFETTNIGGVEYVSREQLEAAMAETRRSAARDGAKRGMSMTLDKLQQSPSTRGRVGIR